MNKKVFLIIAIILSPLLAYGETYWGGELPDVNDTSVEAEATLDGDIYTYTYSVQSGAANTGEIWHFLVDITKTRGGMELSGEGLPSDRVSGMDYMTNTVPIGMIRAGGWLSGINFRYQAGWGGEPLIQPGEGVSGFKITSRGLPGIREFRIEPDIVPIPMELYRNIEQIQEVEDKAAFSGKTLGPTAPPAGSYDLSGGMGKLLAAKMLLEKIFGYIDESVTLGWLTDAALANSLRAKLDSVKQSMDANETTQAKTTLGEFMTLLDGSSPAQRTSEGYGLLYFNAKYLKDNLPDDFIPPITILDLAPVYASLPLGAIGTLTASYTTDGEPLIGAPVSLEVTSGPNTGLTLPEPGPGPPPPPGSRPPTIYTDLNGQAVFSYTSKLLGTDEMTVTAWGEVGAIYSSESVKVNWEGGPDLVIDIFIPPIIRAKGGETVNLKEITVNTGNTSAGPFVIRYFISDDEIIDPATDTSIGERLSSSLVPGTQTESGMLTFVLPADVPDGTYFMGACADADNSVGELDEDNNCHANQVVVMVEPPANQPPDCSVAYPSVASLWPPNHNLLHIEILGVTDPDGDAFTLTVTSITQDEPTNHVVDGDIAPDGFGIGMSLAEVRSERADHGNGRVYAIQFSADDGNGGTCAGSVNVVVPIHEGGEASVIDDGQIYDSTQP